MKTVIMVDGANIWATMKELGFEIDYKKVLKFFGEQQGNTIVNSYYFTAYREIDGVIKLRGLMDYLSLNGWLLVTKASKEYDATHSVPAHTKGNMDVEIAVDMLQAATYADHIILMSGDGDFTHLINAVQRKGVRVTVVSTRRTNPPMISGELRRQVNVFVDLLDIRESIERVQPSIPQDILNNSLEELRRRLTKR